MLRKSIKKTLELLHLLEWSRTARVNVKRSANLVRLRYAVPLFSKTSFLSGIYYLFSAQFRRENHAVLLGTYMNFKEGELLRKSASELARSIHRLEKGISMRHRKKIFAQQYIAETVAYYGSTLNGYMKGEAVSFNRLKWAHDVLEQYFEITEETEQTQTYRKIFKNLPSVARFRQHEEKWIPYKRKTMPVSPVTYEMFMELAKQRRSTRWFLPKPVPRELIDKAIEAAELSPSDCNRSPCEFLIFDDPEAAAHIASIPKGTRGFADNIPLIISVIGKLNAYSNEGSRHGIYLDTGLQSMSLMFALETLGLSSCPLNWPDVERMEKTMENTLGLEAHERVTMFIGVGYPDPEGFIPYSAKKEVEHVRRYAE